MNGWLIYTEADAARNESYIEWFLFEAKRQNVHITLLYREHLDVGLDGEKYIFRYKGKDVSLPSFVVNRTVEPLLQQIFERNGLRVFNPYTVASTANNKSKTYIAMHSLGVPLLPTYFTTKFALPHVPPLPYPFVVKEATGQSGKQVFFIENKKEWLSVQNKLHSTDIVIQAANVQLGRDVRVFVIGKEIIAAVLRKNVADFRANFSLGGSAERYYLSAEQRLIVEKIVHHFSFDLVGIDFFLNDKNEFVFNEIEDVVGSRILSATTSINLLEKYVSYIRRVMGDLSD